MQKAVELAPKVSKRRSRRTSRRWQAVRGEAAEGPGQLDKAFADAMREVHKDYPDDLDAAMLFAEAVMDTMPWDYWAEDGQPQARDGGGADRPGRRAEDGPLTTRGRTTTTSTPSRRRRHPERGLPAAPPAARPGARARATWSTCRRTSTCGWGNYHEASLCNERAIAADEAYIAQVQGAPACTPRCITRTTSISCGTAWPWKGGVVTACGRAGRRWP